MVLIRGGGGLSHVHEWGGGEEESLGWKNWVLRHYAWLGTVAWNWNGKFTGLTNCLGRSTGLTGVVAWKGEVLWLHSLCQPEGQNFIPYNFAERHRRVKRSEFYHDQLGSSRRRGHQFVTDVTTYGKVLQSVLFVVSFAKQLWSHVCASQRGNQFALTLKKSS